MAFPARILLVDDDTGLRDALAEVLGERGYDVVCAAHGVDALALLENPPVPDVILLDLVMPVMDGWAFRAAQLGDPRLAAIPTVILSGSLRDRLGGLAGLAPAASLEKPFELAQLIETVQGLCKAA